MEQQKVAIVDDHKLFSSALSSMIDDFNDYQVLFEAKNGQDFQNKLKDVDVIPDIVLMDYNMPVMNGIETTKWTATIYPEIKVLGLSMDSDEIIVIRMLKAGAKGYILKDVSPKDFKLALDELTHKGYYHSDLVGETMMHALTEPFDPIEYLKKREIEFLKHAATEKTYKEIAKDMYLSPKTIDGYRESLFSKLNIKSRTGLVLYAIKNKIITL